MLKVSICNVEVIKDYVKSVVGTFPENIDKFCKECEITVYDLISILLNKPIQISAKSANKISEVISKGRWFEIYKPKAKMIVFD